MCAWLVQRHKHISTTSNSAFQVHCSNLDFWAFCFTFFKLWLECKITCHIAMKASWGYLLSTWEETSRKFTACMVYWWIFYSHKESFYRVNIKAKILGHFSSSLFVCVCMSFTWLQKKWVKENSLKFRMFILRFHYSLWKKWDLKYDGTERFSVHVVSSVF